MTAAAAVQHSFSLDDPTPGTAWAYRRAARRLRFHFRNDRVGLHRSLRTLAAAVDARSRVTGWSDESRPPGHARRVAARVVAEPPRPAGGACPAGLRAIDIAATAAALRAPHGVVDRFAQEVVAALDEGILRHSRRQALLRRGMRLGLGLFEANLVIAAVQHRHGDGGPTAASAGDGSGAAVPTGVERPARGSRHWSVVAIAILALAIETSAVAATLLWLA